MGFDPTVFVATLAATLTRLKVGSPALQGQARSRFPLLTLF